MSIRANNLGADGIHEVTLGVNSGQAPNTLPPGQIAWMVNATTRTNFPQNRPGWIKRDLNGDTIEPGLFQGSAPFIKNNELVMSVGGRIYTIDLSSMTVTELTGSDVNPPQYRRAWLAEAEDFMLIQDGHSACFIYDGATLRRAEAASYEVPTGTCMAYALGRLWVTLPNGRSYVGSDIVYGDSGTPPYGRRDAILKFTENTLLFGGGAFGIPFLSGKINAMVSLAQTDTSLGQGALQVFTDNGAFSVQAPFERALWALVNYPIQSSSLLGSGALSDWSTTNVNGDIWYRASDGVRSFQVARRDQNTWINTALSHEVERSLMADSRDLLGWSSSALFDGRLIQTCGPYSNYDYGTIHRGFVALDFNSTTNITDRGGVPTWEGEWCGLNILQIVSGVFENVERCFIIALNSENEIELYEVTRDAEFDNDGTDKLIQWEVWGPSLGWEDKGNFLKQLEFGDVFYDQIGDEVTFSMTFRPDQEPNFQAWHNWSSCAVSQTCDSEVDPATGCAPAPPTLGKQYRVKKSLPVPSDDCDTITGKPYRRGFEFQPRLIVTGPCRIQRMRLWASDVPEDAVGGCVDDSTCQTLEACLPDTLAYSIASATDRPT